MTLKAEDAPSGIDRYELTIDGGDAIRKITASEAAQPISLTGLTPGEHSVKVVAFDKAGNRAEITKSFKVESLSTPVINEIATQIELDSSLTVFGSSTPGTLVRLSLVDGAGQSLPYEASTDEQGNFSLIIGPISQLGSYGITARAINSDGLSSQESVAKLFSVIKSQKKSAFVWPEITISWSQVLPLIGWLILIIFMLYGWYKFWITRKKLIAAKKQSEQAFMMLLDRADQQIGLLEKFGKKRKLGRSESLALLELSEIIAKIRQIRKEDD